MDDTQIRVLKLAARGYTCSQIIVQFALDARGEENQTLVQAMAGLAFGCGSGRATCGALAGGCCLLALYGGKRGDGESASEKLPLMLNELSEWFEKKVGETFGGTVCDTITGEEGPAGARQRCGTIVADTVARAMEILVTHGFDPCDA